MADKAAATGYEPVSTVLLTFVDAEGNEWQAGASVTRLRPKGRGLEEGVLTRQLTEGEDAGFKVASFTVVIP